MMKELAIGLVFGKTDPNTISGMKLTDSKSIKVGQLVRIRTGSNSEKKGSFVDILGRIVSISSKNRLLSSESMVPNITVDDLTEGITPKSLGLAKDLAQQITFQITIMGATKDGSFIRLRYPINPGEIIYVASDQFVSEFFHSKNTISIGDLRDNEKVPALIDYNKLVQYHFSILAMTGAGKSYALGVCIEELFLKIGLPILIIDPHSEYSTMKANNPNISNDEDVDRIKGSVKIFVPGKLSNSTEKRFEEKFNLKRMPQTLKFHPAELESWQIKALVKLYYGLSEAQSRELDKAWDEIFISFDSSNPFSESELINKAIDDIDHKGTKKALESKLKALFRRDFFTFDQGSEVSILIQKNQISVLDLGGLDQFDQQALVGLITRKLYYIRKERKIKPFLLVLEEAHNFVPSRTQISASRQAIARLAAEGRKFGIGITVVSQRPSKIDSDVLSQCNSHIILRLKNPTDLKYIKDISEYMTNEDLDALKGLGQGEAMIFGLAVPFTLLVSVKEKKTLHGGVTPDLLEELNS